MTDKTSKKECIQPEIHSGHMCELESQQEWDTIRQITDKLGVKCENCGAEANFSRNVCMPTDL